MKEHQLSVSRTARYSTLGDFTGATDVWIALHGYGQLASTFIGYLATMEAPHRLIVAPEALSRFYLESGRGPVGASWMTREARDYDIADNVAYLEALSTHLGRLVPTPARRHLLGFSQGVATAGRWIDRGTVRFNSVCFWAGTLPPELDLTQQHQAFRESRIALVAGHRDEFLASDWLAKESERLGHVAREVRSFPFHGGHRLDRTVLAAVADWFETQ
jgi:predicted esterase